MLLRNFISDTPSFYLFFLQHYFQFKSSVIKDKLYLLSENRVQIMNFKNELVSVKISFFSSHAKMMLRSFWMVINANPLKSPVKKEYILLWLQIIFLLTFTVLTISAFLIKYFISRPYLFTQKLLCCLPYQQILITKLVKYINLVVTFSDLIFPS